METLKNINKDNFCREVIEKIEKEILSKTFEENLNKMQKIDSNHYSKIITIEDMKRILQEYVNEEHKNKEHEKDECESFLVLLPGNPELVFRTCLEVLRKNSNTIIGIQDFCLAQNTLLIETINKLTKNKFELKNLLKDSEIQIEAQKCDRIICIGDSNLYNRLENKISNIELNSYGIFEIYSDSEEFEVLEESFIEYCYQNEFEIENYNDVSFEDAVKLINKNGYKFCSILFSKNKDKQKEFKEKINSNYVVINKNPLKEIKFKL